VHFAPLGFLRGGKGEGGKLSGGSDQFASREFFSINAARYGVLVILFVIMTV